MTTAVRSRFLDLPALAAVAHMRFTTRHRIDGAYSGRHVSRQQGGAGEFVDFREYTGGEDLRRLDWKVFARTGKAFIRLHQDETNLVCTLAVDGSGSMSFGERTRTGPHTKLEYVQYLTTALSQIIARGQDQVGLAVLRDNLHEYFAPSGTSAHLARVQEAIERISTAPARFLAPGLRQLFERSSRRGVLIVVSDFLADDLDAAFAALRLFRHRAWEVVVLHVVHPAEERLPEGTAYRFEGLEDDGVCPCSPAEIRSAYAERFAAHLAMVRQMAISGGCDYRRVSTIVPYMQVLGGFLVDRTG